MNLPALYVHVLYTLHEEIVIWLISIFIFWRMFDDEKPPINRNYIFYISNE